MKQKPTIMLMNIAAQILSARISSGRHPQDVDMQECKHCIEAAVKLIKCANEFVNKTPTSEASE